MRRLLLLAVVVSGCALRVAAPAQPASAANALAADVAAPPEAAVPERADEGPIDDEVAEALAAPAAATIDDGLTEGEEDEEGDEEVAEEGESHELSGPLVEGFPYTGDLTDEVLAQKWKDDPASLGSISLGFVDQGRIINAVQFPAGESWQVISPAKSWATQETIEYVQAAIRKVVAEHPDAPPLRVNQFSLREGGYSRPHKSHQNGRDVDLGFYYPTAEPIRVRAREKVIDVALNWALVKALVTETDVQMILVDRRVQKVLYDHALSIGEDKAWLDSLFRNGRDSIVKHARRHRDHFHVRFYNGRSQELGRRVAPLLAQRPDQNLAIHRVRRGDTLGAIAVRYNSTVKAIQKANRMRGTFLRIAQVLRVPLRGPCTRCPVPPPVVVPARRLPPALATAVAPAAAPAGIVTAAVPAKGSAAPGSATVVPASAERPLVPPPASVATSADEPSATVEASPGIGASGFELDVPAPR